MILAGLLFLCVVLAEGGILPEKSYYQVVPVHYEINKSIQKQEPAPYKTQEPVEEVIKFIPYAFSYTAEGEDGMSSRTENSDETGRVTGSYTLKDIDGRSRTVEYIADAEGFRAKVKTNEPGTKSDNPANIEFYSSAPEAPPEEPASPQSQKSQISSYKPHSPSTYKTSEPKEEEPKKSVHKYDAKKYVLVPIAAAGYGSGY